MSLYLNKHNVIWIDMASLYTDIRDKNDFFKELETNLLDDLNEAFPNVLKEMDNTISKAIIRINSKLNERFIFLIDEWDVIYREQEYNTKLCDEYTELLRNLFKSSNVSSCIDLVYMTGILPVKKYGEHSALNMFDEYSMTNQRELAEFTGFTGEEVEKLCDEYDMPYDKMKQWYDGYDLKGIQIYNPRSVVMSLLGHDFDSYWTKTETYEALKKYIQLDMYNLKALVIRLIAGESVVVNPDKFQNDMTTLESSDDVLTLLIHLGYLTYDFYKHTVSIPNQEVQKEFINCIEDGGWEPVMDAIRSSEELLAATLSGDEKKVADMIEQVHQENVSILKYNDENSLSCIISLAFYSAKKEYSIYRELAGGKGYADMVFVPKRNVDKPAVIVELKWNKSAETAIKQIKEKQYIQSLKDYKGEVVIAGISYDASDNKNGQFKKHTCKIEKLTL